MQSQKGHQPPPGAVEQDGPAGGPTWATGTVYAVQLPVTGCGLAPGSRLTLREEVPFCQGTHKELSAAETPHRWETKGSKAMPTVVCTGRDAQLPSYCSSHLSPSSAIGCSSLKCFWALLPCLSLPHHPIARHWW